MRALPPGLRTGLVVLVCTVGVSACASSLRAGASVPRPSAFPTAPAPPMAIAPLRFGSMPAPEVPSLVRTAFDLRGVTYRLGGETPADGFDCSGFIRYVFALNHLELPRTVVEQFGLGSKVSLGNVREGDLVFFSTIAPGASHVGLSIGNGEFIHAPGAGGAVRVERLDAAYWHDRVVAVKRIL